MSNVQELTRARSEYAAQSSTAVSLDLKIMAAKAELKRLEALKVIADDAAMRARSEIEDLEAATPEVEKPVAVETHHRPGDGVPLTEARNGSLFGGA